jgi:thiamine-phosphate pyrophosphorylase
VTRDPLQLLVCALSKSRADRRTPILCYVTDRKGLPGLDTDRLLADRIATEIGAGIDWVQIREKDLSAKRLASVIQRAVGSPSSGRDASAATTRIFLNDRLDLALTAGLNGVHLGESSLPVCDAKQLVTRMAGEQEFLVGASCHSLESAKAAERDGADYIFFGPVFATPSKATFGAPQGLEQLVKVCGEVSIPVLAIGGITLENAQACLAAGASGIAAIRLFQDAADLAEIVRVLHSLEV